MSFQAPLPSDSRSPRDPQNPHGGLSGLGFSSNPVGGFFETERTLPMYKDKPYFTPRRTAPRRRWKRIASLLALCALIFFWYNKSSIPSLQGADAGERGARLWKWAQTLEDEVSPKQVDWDARREKVRDTFIVSFEGYEQDAWGFDQYSPSSRNNKNMVEGGLGWMIVDSLDTMILMNLTSQVRHARQWISTSLRYDQDHDVNTFETTIRMLGGLLSAHYLSNQYPNLAPVADDDVGAAGEDLYIEKATDLADRLLGAFESNSGIPFSSINLNTSLGIRSHSDGGSASTAEATTVQLEFKYLAKLTGEAEYWKVVEKVMEVVDGQNPEDGLVPIFIHPDSGQFKTKNIRLGSRGDSYYEYLIKQYLQTSEQEPIYKEMWDESLQGIRKHLLAFSKNAQLMVLGERPRGLDNSLTPKMDHLVCFMPGTIALGATGGQPLSKARQSSDWSQQREEEILISRELMKTCWATYLNTRTGLAPEITHFVLDESPVMMADKYADPANSATEAPYELQGISLPLTLQEDGHEPWRKDIDIHAMDRHNLQRPETVESLFYMYRITGDEIYREWGWDMFKAFVRHTAVVETVTSTIAGLSSPPYERIKSFTSVGNVEAVPPETRDRMESFWLAETLKYFYLLFSDRDFISLEDHVFNTEAHPFPRFKPSGELKTGWERKH
ncbi:Mannosyl-oligosaccharide 1-2-alpha-mannosidase [Penicillium verhagenii]|uniref:Mannosyl-oligosaccharide 1-2-alpha-mannosidase n=1 Tax=Penicillium verhagenii TaxID=1562060 RepID=UPI002545115F|nr:Mannosyl-oligosaccharide 1-2-alpha-mannosidase [Penicillium verhagenii]KAJ5947047.1 Mannosyl-oligosaccharide 1-2-alpha-mannosidase [Penicillium verhagenii]